MKTIKETTTSQAAEFDVPEAGRELLSVLIGTDNSEHIDRFYTLLLLARKRENDPVLAAHLDRVEMMFYPHTSHGYAQKQVFDASITGESEDAEQ